MKVVGIVAEYNPFHLGHAFHLKKARELTGAEYALVAMSGNFVQRGAPAMFDKYTRAQAALKNGADLVLELPVGTAAGSAEHFAAGAVGLLEDTGIVTDLCFGSECGELRALMDAAAYLAEESDAYKKMLKEYLKRGEPFPKARSLALKSAAPEIQPGLLDTPNNLLGLEYLKALIRLKSEIRPWTIPRKGQGFREETFPASFASASAIRNALIEDRGQFTEALRAQLPSAELYQAYDGKTPITEDAFSLLLLEKLIRLEGQPLDGYFDVSPELSNRISSHLEEYQSFRQFAELVKTRNLTYTAVSRALMHILLDIRKPEADPRPARETGSAPVPSRRAGAFRVLGFRKDAEPLLKELEKNGSLPLITSPKDTRLPAGSLYPDHLYEAVRALLHGMPFQSEYRRKMLVVS